MKHISACITFIMILCVNAPCQVGKTTSDTIPNYSYDNFKNNPNSPPSYVVIKSKETGKILYEHNIQNGKCIECYDRLTSKADSCFKDKNYSDATTLYTSAFTLNENKGKVKHRLNAACCFVKLNDFDNAYDNLNRVVFGAKFSGYKEIASNDCYKPLQKDARWPKLIDGLNKNIEGMQQKIKADTPEQ